MIYLDNAATSWPKPETVYRAADQALRNAANPGRGGHRFSRDSARLVLQGREAVARFFGVQNSRQIIFSPGATQGLNMIIYGLVPGIKSILSVGFEHNAIWRPLVDISRRLDVDVKFIDPLTSCGFDWDMFQRGLAENPDLVTITHASNVTGQVFPLEEMIKRAKLVGALTCADLSQTAGVLTLDFEGLGLDFAAFPGHKSLLGPQGIGGVYIRPGLQLRPLHLGGTGSNSSDPEPPRQLPDRYESGTINVSGIAGLAAGISFLEEKGLDSVLAHELDLRNRAAEGLRNLGATLYGSGPVVGALSFNFPGVDSAELAFILDEVYNISVRGGLHCSPRAHHALNTTQSGTVRISPGIFNTAADIDILLNALEQIRQTMR